MENNINKQYKSNNMDKEKSYLKKFLMFGAFLWLLVISFHSVFGVTEQTHLVWYPFESASASTIFDMSGNNINAILVNGAIPQTTNTIWGARNLFCDGVNDYAISTLFDLTPQYSVSFWVRPTSAVTKDYYAVIDDGIDTAFEVEFDGTNNILELGYYNDSKDYTHRIIDNTIFTAGTWYNIVVTIDADNDRFSYYKNGQPIIVNGVFPDGYSFNGSLQKDIHLCINRDFNLSKIFGGKVDEFRILNFEADLTQVQELYNSNTITFLEINETPIIDPEITLIQTNLINSTNLVMGSSNNKIRDLYVVLNNITTSCEIYFDYELYDSSVNLLSFKSTKEFEFGNHSYYVYCEKNENGIKYYDLTDIVYFQVEPGVKAIEFYFLDQNSDKLFGEDWYAVTPCFPPGASDKYWDFDEDHYIKNLLSGYASFNLNYTAQHEFCLYRGTINYNSEEDFATRNIEVLNILKKIDLGEIFVGVNTTSYTLNLDNQDKYDVYEPGFWGKTYENLFTFIWGLVIGGLMILLGLLAKSDKLIVIGGLVILGGFGFSTFSLLGVIF